MTPMDLVSAAYPILTVFVFIFGACIGSFLNVCVYRIPREESLVAPRSHCPHCGKMIAWFDNIPLLSYLALRARCRHCKGAISSRYFFVELLTAALFVLVWLKMDPGPGPNPLGVVPAGSIWLVPIYWLAVSGFVLGSIVALEHMIRPDRVTIGGIVAGLVLSVMVPWMHGEDSRLHGFLWSLFGASLGVGLLWSIAGLGSFIFKKEAMGLGDVKLLGAIGAFFGWRAVLFSVMLSSLIGSISGLSLVLFRRKAMQSRIPYGPYLAMAALVWIFWGRLMWDWYTGLFQPRHPEFETPEQVEWLMQADPRENTEHPPSLPAGATEGRLNTEDPPSLPAEAAEGR